MQIDKLDISYSFYYVYSMLT